MTEEGIRDGIKARCEMAVLSVIVIVIVIVNAIVIAAQ